ncbi:hypothetical protein EON79_19135 [bacterium]|nr:MAG: hypothetical protein EON79_19135 [bacterium]
MMIATALAFAPTAFNIDPKCPAVTMVPRTVLVPFVEKPAYSRDPRQHIYRKAKVLVPVHKNGHEKCTCGKD